MYSSFQKKANDPSRFNNRGGNLLKEEKQRADLQKTLPKVQDVKQISAALLKISIKLYTISKRLPS